MSLAIGNLVTYQSAPGIGRVGDLRVSEVRVDFFESAACPLAEAIWMPVGEVRRARLGEQSRVFFQDANKSWRAGRVVGGGPDVYFVRVPNREFDVDLHEERLRIRWEKPPRDPLQVLLSGANETPRFRDAREPVKRLLLAERAATGSATGIMSSGVRLHAHQINAALRVIRDPVQRYLLADEVGMGKTIQAGMVVRQLLIDRPGRSVGVLVPDPLVAQWVSELQDKFYVDDFPTPDGESAVRVVGHSQYEQWRALDGVELLVVDEAHLLARTADPASSPYSELARLAHSASRLLMLSATPFTEGPATQLALLHLLDPQMFRWERIDDFERLLEVRYALAMAVFGLDEEPDVDNPGLLELQLNEITEHLPQDELLSAAISRAMSVYGPPGTPPSEVDEEALRLAVAAVRAHVSETYRLHHRVIRNRRHVVEMQSLDDAGLLTPFEFTGRKRPRAFRLKSGSRPSEVLHRWVTECSAAVLDAGADPATYAPIAAIMASRVGGSPDDLREVLAFRTSGAPGQLTDDERARLRSAPSLPFEHALLEDLEPDTDEVVAELAQAISQRTNPKSRTVVFCGRGRLAEVLCEHFATLGLSSHVFSHLREQNAAEREEATQNWRARGGILVADESGDVGRNLQEANVVFHLRVPGDPNALEQRIGRVDRYGRPKAADQYVLVDDVDGVVSAWVRVLVTGFGIFDASVSAMQEVVDRVAYEAWRTLLEGGIEAMLGQIEHIRDSLAKERRRINELDALESSFGGGRHGNELATAIAAFEDGSRAIETAYRKLVEGVEGYRFSSRSNKDGSIRFERSVEDKPLISERLLARLVTVEQARTGYFDRWQLTAGRRLFRRGNPFIDGIEQLLELDDRGQAVALWRLTPSWHSEPLAFFGFDYLVEADLAPIMSVTGQGSEAEPMARRRVDSAFPPERHRVWVPVSTRTPVVEPGMVRYLDEPLRERRDVNLNAKRIPALHAVLGGEEHLSPIAHECEEVARRHIVQIAGLVERSRHAVDQIRGETVTLSAQHAARSAAEGLVADPDSLKIELELSRAIEAGVLDPVVRLSGVSCLVVSAQSWSDFVQG